MLLVNPGAAPRHPVQTLSDADPAIWLDLVSPTDEERAAAERATGLHVPTQPELAEIESTSRTFTRGEILFLSTPMAFRSADGESAAAPLGFVLSPTHLITVRFAHLPVFDSFAEAFARGDVRHAANGPCSTSAFLGLLEAIVDRLADVLEHVGGDLNTLSRNVFRPRRKPRDRGRNSDRLRTTLSQVGRLGDGLSNIRDSLLGVSRIVNFTPGAAREWMPAELRPRFKALHQDLISLTDYDNQLTNKVQLLLDATLGFINIEQNDTFRVLTVVSVVGIPPTLIASIYGMNFEHIPELHWAFGYPYGLSMIALSALVPMLLFWLRGWI